MMDSYIELEATPLAAALDINSANLGWTWTIPLHCSNLAL